MSYVDNIMNSIVISYVSCMDIKTTILSLKNSSPGYDELPASIAKQCIYNCVVPLTYIINMSLMEGVFPSEQQLYLSLNLGNLIKLLIIDRYLCLSFFSKIFLWINMMQFININLGSENNHPFNTLL